jgi:DMSO reductase family type II enzyme heme b subunit
MAMVTGQWRKWMAGAVGVAGLAAVAAQPAAYAQESVAVRASLVKGSLPVDDPTAAAWSTASQAEFPMSPQVHWPVRITEVTAKSIKVKGLHDGTNVAILLEFADPSEDPEDAAAIEFMVGDTKAHFAHGQTMGQVEGGPVNIWYWKNKDGKAVDMSAKGFGTLKPQAHQDVKAKGMYQDGVWKVVFSRPFTTENTAEDTQLKPGDFTGIAFALWDGKKTEAGQPKEKGSEKAVSSWWYFRADPPQDYSPYLYAGLAIALAVGFELVLVRRLKKGS